MTREKFEKDFLEACEYALGDVLDKSKKYNFDEGTLHAYGSGFLMGYLGEWLRINGIVELEVE